MRSENSWRAFLFSAQTNPNLSLFYTLALHLKFILQNQQFILIPCKAQVPSTHWGQPWNVPGIRRLLNSEALIRNQRHLSCSFCHLAALPSHFGWNSQGKKQKHGQKDKGKPPLMWHLVYFVNSWLSAGEEEKPGRPSKLRPQIPAGERTSPGASQNPSASFSLVLLQNLGIFGVLEWNISIFIPKEGCHATSPHWGHSVGAAFREIFSLMCPCFSCSPCSSFPPSCPSLHCPSSPSFLVFWMTFIPPVLQRGSTLTLLLDAPKTRGNKTLGGTKQHLTNPWLIKWNKYFNTAPGCSHPSKNTEE